MERKECTDCKNFTLTKKDMYGSDYIVGGTCEIHGRYCNGSCDACVDFEEVEKDGAD